MNYPTPEYVVAPTGHPHDPTTDDHFGALDKMVESMTAEGAEYDMQRAQPVRGNGGAVGTQLPLSRACDPRTERRRNAGDHRHLDNVVLGESSQGSCRARGKAGARNLPGLQRQWL